MSSCTAATPRRCPRCASRPSRSSPSWPRGAAAGATPTTTRCSAASPATADPRGPRPLRTIMRPEQGHHAHGTIRLLDGGLQRRLRVHFELPSDALDLGREVGGGHASPRIATCGVATSGDCVTALACHGAVLRGLGRRRPGALNLGNARNVDRSTRRRRRGRGGAATGRGASRYGASALPTDGERSHRGRCALGKL